MGNDMIKIDGINYKKEVFIIEENHPAIGRILIVEGAKFKILDEEMRGHAKTGTFMKRLSEDDEQTMQEYDDAVDELSEKLTQKVDIKRLIKENIKTKTLQEVKTGLFILKQETEGKKIEEEHIRGCYNYNMFYKNQGFSLITGSDVLIDLP